MCAACSCAAGVCLEERACCGDQRRRVLALQVIERVVEVEPDKAAIVEQLRQQMKEEMEQHQQQLEGQALEAARQEAEARAKQQLEVSRTAANQGAPQPVLAVETSLCVLHMSSWCSCPISPTTSLQHAFDAVHG